MATLTVWKFDTPEGAELAEEKLQQLQKQELITIDDAAIVTWPESKKGPKTRQVNSVTGVGALGGAFWGLLFGLLFFVPLLGMAIGAGLGAAGGALADVGIDDDFIASIRQRIRPGTSALFVLTQDAVIDKVRESFAGTNAELIHSNLSAEDEDRLRAVFADA